VSVEGDSAGVKVTPVGLEPHVTCITATTGGPATHSGVNVGVGSVGVQGGSWAGIAIENVTSSPLRVQLVGIVVGQANPAASVPVEGPNVYVGVPQGTCTVDDGNAGLRVTPARPLDGHVTVSIGTPLAHTDP